MKLAEEQIALFWSKVSKTGGCWLWQDKPHGNGYGYFRRVAAHRLSWELHHGKIVNAHQGKHGTCVLHRCDVRLCVNPEHLFLGSQRENLQDMWRKNRGVIPRLHGAEAPRTKLTPEQVREIRNTATPGRALARKFGVSKTAIYLVRKGLNWRHDEL